MLLPPVRERREIDRLLTEYFRDPEPASFQRAVRRMVRYYRLPVPRVTWFEYLDWGKSGGRTYQSGEIHLVHPVAWKRGRKYNTERRWINTIYHEMGHYVLWSDAERKADTFACRMVRGLNRRSAPRSSQREPSPTASQRAEGRMGAHSRREGRRGRGKSRTTRPGSARRAQTRAQSRAQSRAKKPERRRRSGRA